MPFPFIHFKAPSDTSTAQGRAQERHRRIALSVISSAISQGVSIISSFIWIPIVISYLGSEMYGLIMTFVIGVSIFQFADLGIGNGLINIVSEAKGKDDYEDLKNSISTGFFVLSFIAIFIVLIFICIDSKISWIKIFNIKPSLLAIGNVNHIVFIFFICFALTLPLSVVQKVQIGLQKGFITNLCQLGGSLLTLIIIVSVVYYKAGTYLIIWAIAGVPVFVLLANNFFYWIFSEPSLKPSIHKITLSHTKRLFGIGWLFFVLSIAGALGFQSDSFILLHIFGPEKVALYVVVAKIFSVSPMILGYILMPLWPAYREALVREDYEWVKKTLIKSIKLGLAINIPSAIILVLFGSQIIKLWIGKDITPSLDLLLGFGIWTVMNGIVGPFAAFYNSANLIKFQITTSLMMGISNILISILLADLLGASGVIYGSIIALVLFTLLPCYWKIQGLFVSFRKNRDSKVYE